MKVLDIAAISDLAHSYNKDIIVVVDNTFLTSYFQRPLELGADIVAYSLSKYMNGHSDVIMGAAIINDQSLYERLQFLQNASGIVPSPFDCYQVNRSLKTLAIRMEQHSKGSLQVAKFLEGHKHVERVLHPGSYSNQLCAQFVAHFECIFIELIVFTQLRVLLYSDLSVLSGALSFLIVYSIGLPSHPQHALTLKQTYGHSGIMSFYLKGALKESRKFLQELKVFTLAESLGGFESLAELPLVFFFLSENHPLHFINDKIVKKLTMFFITGRL